MNALFMEASELPVIGISVHKNGNLIDDAYVDLSR